MESSPPAPVRARPGGGSRRPRPGGISRLVLVVVLAVLAVASVPGVAGAALPAPQPDTSDSPDGRGYGPAERVLVVSLPTFRWSDVVSLAPPNLRSLLERSAVGSMSLRSVGAAARLDRSYATIGAGNRATAPPSVSGDAMAPDDEFEGTVASAIFERRCACEVGDAAVVHLGMSAVTGGNDRLLYGSEPGSLGQALAEAGLSTGVVANGDTALPPEEEPLHRPAALAVADDAGRVAHGTVGPELLEPDDTAPFGLRTDLDAAEQAFTRAWSTADVVVLEASDLHRVDQYRPLMTAEAYGDARRAAVDAADELLGRALEQVDLERDLVIVLAPTDPARTPVEMGVGAVAGPGVEPGLATSGGSQRPGYLTLAAVSHTVLDVLGVEIPSQMSGGPMWTAEERPVDTALLEGLVDANDRAVFRMQVSAQATIGFVVLQIVAFAAAAVALGTRRRRNLLGARLVALWVLGVPSAAFLSGLFPYRDLGVAGYLVALFAAGFLFGVLAHLASVLARRRGLRPELAVFVAPVALVVLIFTVLMVDVAFGGATQMDTVFGYGGGPIVAGRFIGFGNLAFALVMTSVIVLGTVVHDLRTVHRSRPGRPAPGRSRRLLVATAALFVTTVLAIGLPSFGINVGGVLTSVPTFLLTLLLLAGWRFNLRRVVGLGVATLVVISTFAAFDLLRPEGSRTHLGRFVTLGVEQGVPGLATVIERKLAANLSILTSSIWTLLIPLVLLFLAFLTWLQPQFLRSLHDRMPATRPCFVGALTGAVIGGLVNDSGVAITAMVFAVAVPYLTVLILWNSGSRGAGEPLLDAGALDAAAGGPGDPDVEPEVATR